MRDEELKLQYTQFMGEYLKMGLMENVFEESYLPKTVFYLSHHIMLMLSSLTTKFQVVFDASAKSLSNLSLNVWSFKMIYSQFCYAFEDISLL